MSRAFTITTPTNLARADAEGRVQVQFTVTNTSGTLQRRLFRAVPLGDAKEPWLSLGGESERAFPADGVHQVSVTAAVPPGTPAGRYGLRLDAIAATRVGEEIEEGPAVYFDVAASAPPARRLPWVWIAAVLVLLVGGAGALLLMRALGQGSETRTADTGKPKQGKPPMGYVVRPAARPVIATAVGTPVVATPVVATPVVATPVVATPVTAAPVPTAAPVVVQPAKKE